ncbi:hypothetical protein [Hylemonella gracilis]|uniref:DUF2917 domain-containing protein n=1 Tax=Hylemonella gracilis ATCC 19624 TaxID=887062 RepID=F3KP78_9BURK|nr:hypothetical protein [Hylemonella gracilis]EGI78415.1 hypothetical protein HGR_01177 [Hylemonella gracilis ATCC 19624]
MTAALAEFIELEPGQTLRVAVDAGAWVHVVAGHVRLLSPPSWLGETMFRAEVTLSAEEVHRVERGGWIEVEAQTAAQVQVVPRAVPVPVRSAHFAGLGRWMRLLAGRLTVFRIR